MLIPAARRHGHAGFHIRPRIPRRRALHIRGAGTCRQFRSGRFSALFIFGVAAHDSRPRRRRRAAVAAIAEALADIFGRVLDGNFSLHIVVPAPETKAAAVGLFHFHWPSGDFYCSQSVGLQ